MQHSCHISEIYNEKSRCPDEAGVTRYFALAVIDAICRSKEVFLILNQSVALRTSNHSTKPLINKISATTSQKP